VRKHAAVRQSAAKRPLQRFVRGLEHDVDVRGAARLAAELAGHRDRAALFRDLATLRTDAPVYEAIDELRWQGPRPTFFEMCARLNAPGLLKRAQALAR